MTDFLAWWADHWPLIPLAVLWVWREIELYLWQGRFGRDSFAQVERVLEELRRREP